MKLRSTAAVAVAISMLGTVLATAVGADHSVREVAPAFHHRTEDWTAHWLPNHYTGGHYYTCRSDQSLTEAWAVWSWDHTPAGRYRIEVYIPPQEATAIVSYNIGSNSDGPIMDRVWLNQNDHRGGWAALTEVDYSGGRLWMEIWDIETQASGPNDWCAWGGHHTIGAANARLVHIDERVVAPPPPNSEPPGQTIVHATGGQNELWVSWSADSGSGILVWELAHTYPDGTVVSETFDGWETSVSWFNQPVGEHVIEIIACNEYGCGTWGRDTALVRSSETTEPAPPPDTGGPTGNSRVEMSLGGTNSASGDCPYSQLPCRWVDVTLREFPAGSYPVRCVWLHSESGAERVSTSGTIQHDGGTSATLGEVCYFNVRVGRSVHVTVGDVRSNTVRFTGDPVGDSPSPSPPSPPPPPVGEPPGAPGLSVRIDESSGGRTLIASWSPSADDGGSPITGYEVTTSRPGRTFGPHDRPPSARSYRLNRLRDNTTYTVLVAAKNEYGTGRPARESIRTTRLVGEPPDAPSLRVRLDGSSGRSTLVAEWSPPADDGGSPLSGYRITIERPGRTIRPLDRPANARSYRLGNLHGNTTYSVSVAATNEYGIGRSDRYKVTTPCPVGGKYITRKLQRAVLGLPIPWSGATVIVAERSFRTAFGTLVTKGDQGGVVSSGNENLDQSGCSWITAGASVVDRARVEDNALVSGRARVYGDAEVVDEARIYGNAHVLGNADIYDHAEVHGNAKVYGNANVYSNAAIFGNMEISSGDYDGDQEYTRAARELYQKIFGNLRQDIVRCRRYSEGVKGALEGGHDMTIEKFASIRAKLLMADLLGVAVGAQGRIGGTPVSEIHQLIQRGSDEILCAAEEIVRKIVEEHSNVASAAVMSFSRSVSVLRLVGFARDLTRLASTANEIKDILDEVRIPGPVGSQAVSSILDERLTEIYHSHSIGDDRYGTSRYS